MLTLVAAAVLSAPHSAADAPVLQKSVMTAWEARSGFVPLFDGQSLSGWKGWKRSDPPSAWKARNGELVLAKEEGGGGDLCTAEPYGDFDLRLEWKIAKNGNSGVIYRAGEDYDYSWKTGPEYQILDDWAGGRTRPTVYTSGAFYEMYAAPFMLARPAGEWNETRIVCRGNRVEHWLNSVLVVSCEIGSDDWMERYQKSKFRAFPEFGKKAEGFIVLQDHGNEVAFRRVRIRKL
jgi:hypothetical protein